MKKLLSSFECCCISLSLQCLTANNSRFSATLEDLMDGDFSSAIVTSSDLSHIRINRKVAYVLDELKLTYETKFLDFNKNEHKDPEHTKFNPNGRIPTLIDHHNNDFVLWSIAKSVNVKSPLILDTSSIIGSLTRFCFTSSINMTRKTVSQSLMLKRNTRSFNGSSSSRLIKGMSSIILIC